MHVAKVRLYNATPAQLTTSGHVYNSDMTQQNDTTMLAMFSTIG
jgi:hypothetical protein